MPDNIQLLGIEFDATNLVSGLNKVAQRLDKLEEQFDSTGKAGKKLNTRIAGLEKKLRETSIANRALEKSQRGLNFQLDRYKKKVENATTAIAALKNKNKELNVSLRETQRANDLLAKNLARVEVRVTKLQKKAITAAAALATLRDKNKELSAALRLSERETKKLQSTVTKLAARVDKLEKQFKNAQTRINQYRVAARGAAKDTAGLGGKVIALTAGFLALRAISSALRGLFGVNRDFQQLQAQLIAVTGGLDNAGRAFRQLTRFAVETPFEVQNLVRAFTQLSAVGVPATTETLRRFGDFSSAFGEDITTFTNAVIRGAAGETEALKRFGVTASVQGNNITVQFRDFTRTTKRNFTDVTEVFKELSALNFEGAMTRQMETIIGSISNLKDAGSLLAFAIGERGGMNEAFRELVETLITAVQATDRYAEAIGGGFAKAMGVATNVVENMIDHSEGLIKSFTGLGAALLAIGGVRVISGLGKTAFALRALTLAHPVTAVLGLAAAIGVPLLLSARKADKQMADLVGTAREIGSIALVGEVERYAKEMDALAESLHRASKAAPRRTLFSTGIEPHILNLQAAAVKEYAIQLEKMFGILKAGQSGTLETGQLVGLLPDIAEQVVAEQQALQRLQQELEDRPTGAEGRKRRRGGAEFRSTDVIKKEAAYYQERLSLAQGYFNSVSQLANDQLAAERAAAVGRDNDDARTAFLRLQRFERLVTALEVEKLALTDGAEASLRYKLATDDLTGSFQETIVALTQEVEGLREVEKARADAQAEQIRLVEENARAVDDRKRSVEALLQSQEEEIFLRYSLVR